MSDDKEQGENMNENDMQKSRGGSDVELTPEQQEQMEQATGSAETDVNTSSFRDRPATGKGGGKKSG